MASKKHIDLTNLHALTVIDLRVELEKRGLEKSGLKADLLKRLEKCILDEKKSGEKKKTSDSPANKKETSDSPANKKKEKQKIKENGGDDVVIVKKESDGPNEDSVEADSNLDSVHSDSEKCTEKDSGEPSLPDQQNPDSEMDTNKDTVEVNSSDCQPDNSESELHNEPADSTSQVILEECVDSTSTELEKPESELTTEHADSTTSDQQQSNGTTTKDHLADSTSGQIENAALEEDQVESEDINELPEDERTGSPHNEVDTLPVAESSDNVIIIPDDDNIKDEEMAEEDQNRSEQEKECDGNVEEDNTNVDNNAGDAECMDTSKTEENDSSDASETLMKADQSEIVVIDDDDNDDVSIIELDDDSKKKDDVSNTSKDKSSDKSNPTETGKKDTEDSVTEKSPSDSQTDVITKEKSTEKLNASTTESNDTSSSSKSVKSTRTSRQTPKESKVESKKSEVSKDEKKKDLSRCLWISGLSSVTKAIDLKELFSQHGKVIGAKVVTSAKTPGSQCFGFVTMSTAEESLMCIEKLHKSLLHEKNIQVEKAKTDPTPSKKAVGKSKSGDRKDDEKTRTSRHSSKSQHGALSRPSRRDDRAARRPRDDVKKAETEKKHSDKGKDKKAVTDSKGTSKPSTPKSSASKDSSKEIKVKGKSRSVSKEVEKVDKSPIIEEEKKDDVENDPEKDEEKDEEKEKNIKTLDQLRKERADKIEKEHKLREDRKKKERERERQLREERRREQEKREKERKERARREAERVRREREKQRGLEKQREREREKERERFIRERREREEKERKEREKEREQLERERLERERLDRERRERERLENERIERENEERERLEKERLAREEHDNRIERERQRLEKERLERERTDRDRRGIMVDRGLGNKRPLLGDDRRPPGAYYPEPKRSLHDTPPGSRKDFFSPTSNRDEKTHPYVSDTAYDRVYDRRDNPHKLDNRGKPEIREPRTPRENSRGDAARHDGRQDSREYDSSGKERLGYNQQSSDIRRVVQRENQDGETYSRDRSPHRVSETGSRYRGDHGARGQNWLESSNPNPNAPKTLSDVLGRAGLTGILGSRAEEKAEKPFSPRMNDVPASRSGGDKFYPSGGNESLRTERNNDRSYRADDRTNNHVVDYREDRGKVESRDRREPRNDDHRAPRIDDRRETRYDDRRIDQRPDTHTDNRTEYRRDDRTIDYKHNRPGDDRRDTRADNRRENNPSSINSNVSNDRMYNGANRSHNPLSVTDRRGLHPLANEIGTSMVPTVIQPRVLPLTDMFGRPLQAVPANPSHALQAGYAAAAQGLALQHVGHTGIQLNRNGRLEYTRMPTPQTNIPPMRRF